MKAKADTNVLIFTVGPTESNLAVFVAVVSLSWKYVTVEEPIA
jgi:hypothetical protein